MIYLASPYNHTDAAVRNKRYKQLVEIVPMMWDNGTWVFSPILHNHAIRYYVGEDKPHDFYMDFDLRMLRVCEELYILRIQGWKESRGIALERAFANGAGIPTIFLDEDQLNRLGVAGVALDWDI